MVLCASVMVMVHKAHQRDEPLRDFSLAAVFLFASAIRLATISNRSLWNIADKHPSRTSATLQASLLFSREHLRCRYHVVVVVFRYEQQRQAYEETSTAALDCGWLCRIGGIFSLSPARHHQDAYATASPRDFGRQVGRQDARLAHGAGLAFEALASGAYAESGDRNVGTARAFTAFETGGGRSSCHCDH